MKLTAFLIMFAVTVSSLASCARVGAQFDLTHVPDVEAGVHAQDQITAWFGRPNEVRQISNPASGAVERWIYVYAQSAAGLSTESHSFVVDFDAEGVVCDHAYFKVE